MTEPSHFYTVGGTLPPTARSYVTRHADLALLSHLLRGDFCYVLTSRQMGKSSLMVRTAGALRQNGVSVAILDLTRLGQNLTPEQWYDGLLVRLGAELKLADELDEYWVQDRVSRLGPMQRFIGALRDVVLPSRKGNFVIFIDEIDSVRSLPFSSDEFFAGIRELYNSRVIDPEMERISFCLLGVAQPSDLISNVNITPFNIGHRVELTDFTEAEAQPLLQGLGGQQDATGKETNDVAVLRRVLYWTGGHPYLTQRLCEALAQTGKSVTRADVDSACEALFLSSRSREKEDNLLFVRDRVLAEKEDRSSILDLYSKVLRGKKIKDDDANPTIDVLRLSGIVSVSNGYLKVRNRIYSTVFNRAWVIANMLDAELRRQRAAYRRGLGLAASIGLVVLTIVGILGAVAYHFQDADRKAEDSQRKAEDSQIEEHFFAEASAAQEAFENGDMKTGKSILARLQNSKPTNPTLSELLKGFSFGLLQQEQVGNRRVTIFHEGNDKNPVAGEQLTGCGEFRAVASTVWNRKRLVAAGGADSIVYLWDASGDAPPRPLAALQFRHQSPRDPTPPYTVIASNPPSCQKMQRSGPGIMSLSFSPDGRRLAIATGSWGNQTVKGQVWLWDMDDRTKLKDLEAKFRQAADSDIFSSGGKILAASSDDNTARIWRLSGLIRTTKTFNPSLQYGPGNARKLVRNGANAVAISSTDLHLLALGYGDGHLVFYDYLRPQGSPPLVNQIVHVSGIMSLLFIGAKKMQKLVVGTRDGDLLIFDLSGAEAAEHSGGQLLSDPQLLSSGQGILQSLAASQDRKWLATGGSDGTILLWNWRTLERAEIFRGHAGRIYGLAFCPTESSSAASDCLISASQDKTVRKWLLPQADPQKENVTQTRLLVHGQAVGVAYPGPDTIIAALGSTTDGDSGSSGDIILWHPSNESAPPIRVDGGAPIVSFDVSPDGKFAATSSRDNNLVLQPIVGDVQPAQPLAVGVTLSSIHISCASKGKPNNGRTCPDGKYWIAGIADTGGQAEGLCLWRVVDNGPRSPRRFTIPDDNVNPCLRRQGSSSKSSAFQNVVATVTATAFTRDGAKVAISLIDNQNGKSDGKTHVYVWNTSDLIAGKVNFEYRSGEFTEQFYQLAFSSDGTYLAGTTVTSSLYYWPTANTDSVPTEHQRQQLDPLAVQSGDEKEKEWALDLSSRGMTLAFAPAPYNVLAIGLEDSRILLWSTTYHRVALQIHRHTGGVQGLAFSPDGSQFASAGNDGHVILLQDSDPAKK